MDKILVLGLGNPLLGDDGVGLRAAELVRRALPPDTRVKVEGECVGGLSLMERLLDYDRAILIDAICTRAHPVGTILRLGPDDLTTQHTASSHDVSLPTALRLARRMHLNMPREIQIIAVEAERVYEFDETCSPMVAAALPKVVVQVLEQLARWDSASQTKTPTLLLASVASEKWVIA